VRSCRRCATFRNVLCRHARHIPQSLSLSLLLASYCTLSRSSAFSLNLPGSAEPLLRGIRPVASRSSAKGRAAEFVAEAAKAGRRRPGCRATAARRPASGVAIIRQGPRSGRAVAEAAEAGRRRPGCRATSARRPASGVAIIRQGPRSGRAVAEAADEGRQRRRSAGRRYKRQGRRRPCQRAC
jgi:hypothetical protein